jgi:hypothetical protein
MPGAPPSPNGSGKTALLANERQYKGSEQELFKIDGMEGSRSAGAK